jgi:hypothetical protein
LFKERKGFGRIYDIAAGSGMPAPDEYRAFAAKCLALAQSISDPDDKARLIEMAQAWRDLADKIEAATRNQEKK